MSNAMVEFNEFLVQSRNNGSLMATIVNAGSSTQVETFLVKLNNLLSRASSKIQVIATKIDRPGSEKGSHASLVSDVMATSWRPADNLSRFAALHDVGQHVFHELLAATPGKGGGLAGATLLKGNISDKDLVWSVDSVFAKSFADAYAILFMQQMEGSELALAMAEDALAARNSSGDFTVFSTNSNSYDSQAALRFIIDDIEKSVPIPTDAISLGCRALELAAHGTGEWLNRNGIPLSKALALSKYLNFVSQAISEQGNISGGIHKPPSAS